LTPVFPQVARSTSIDAEQILAVADTREFQAGEIIDDILFLMLRTGR
jgi:hypothetical protein